MATDRPEALSLAGQNFDHHFRRPMHGAGNDLERRRHFIDGRGPTHRAEELLHERGLRFSDPAMLSCSGDQCVLTVVSQNP